MKSVCNLLLTIYVGTLFFLSLFFWLLPATLLLSLFGAQTRMLRHRLLWRACRFATRHFPGVKFTTGVHSEKDFTRPAILISNHQSSLDLLCLLMLTPRLVVVTNQRQWHNALYGAMIRRMDFLPISVGFEEMVSQVESLVRDGYSVAIFPEGTRSRNGRIGRFHQGAFALAARLQLPLVPVVIRGTGEIFPKGSRVFRRGKIDVGVSRTWAPPADNAEDVRQVRHLLRAYFISEAEQP